MRRMTKVLACFMALLMALSTPLSVAAQESNTVSGNVEVIENVEVEETVSDNEDVVVEDDVTVSDNESVTDEEVVEEDNEEVTEEVTVSENEEVTDETVTVSENEEVTEETEGDKETMEEAEFIFPGLPTGYLLSDEELEGKVLLSETVSDLDNMDEGTDYVAGEVIFLCDDEEQANIYAAAYGAELVSYADGVAKIMLPEKVSVKRAVMAAADPNMNLPVVSPNYYRYTCEVEEEVASQEDYEVSIQAYSDPFLNPASSTYQWQHQTVGSTYAWNNKYMGAGVKVGVLDTGIASHQDLKIAYFYDATTASVTSPKDLDDHGTHVAGIIGALQNNVGGSGIAPQASLYGIRVFDDNGSCTSEYLVRGINMAVTQGVQLINMSLGGIGYSTTEQTAVKNAVNKGVAVFAAAGNDLAHTKSYPAAFSEVICIAATDTNNARAYFSNYGSWVDLAAPGVDIYSTMPGGYGYMSGTSQATPVAVGTAAVILASGHKGLKDKNGVALTGAAKVKALEKIMKSNVIKASGSKIGSGITYLPKALGVSTSSANPNAPKFSVAKGTYNVASMPVSITAEGGMTIYYSTDGKNPSFKNGEAKDAIKYTGAFTVKGDMNGKATNNKITVKAIAVNAVGKVSKVASVSYTFKPLVSAITISGLQQVPAGKSISLKADVTPAYAANKKVTWTITGDPKTTGVSINAGNGKISTKKTATPGTYTVTAIAKDGSGAKKTYTVKVIAAAKVNSMKFSAKSVTITRGSTNVTEYFSPLLKTTDANGKTIANNGNVIWSSSDESVIVPNQSGYASAVAAGNATITATAADGSGKKATIKVVVKQNATALTITGSNYLAAGKSLTLKATVAPEKATKTKITWTINGDPATSGVSINQNSGKVTAKATAKAGTYTVTATDANGVKKTHTVVVANAITKISLSATKATIFRVANKAGAPTSKSFTVSAEGAYNANKINVTNSAPGIVTATLSGTTLTVKATGKAAGKATITLKTNDGSNKAAKVEVTVDNPASNLTISPDAGRLEAIGEGKKLKLSAVLETEFGALSSAGKKIKWESSNPSVATVDAKGTVTAKTGAWDSAVITATTTDGSKLSASYTVYTYEDITSLSIGGLSSSLRYYDYYSNGGISLKIKYNGEWLADDAGVFPYVSIESSNPDVISPVTGMDSSGYMYADLYYMKRGTAVITIKALDGSGKTSKINLEVR